MSIHNNDSWDKTAHSSTEKTQLIGIAGNGTLEGKHVAEKSFKCLNNDE